ncbi:MAG TPA: B12-binding domain-containing radical SAM protein [Candidatus Brocadiia bacterium]|nr:radical SAM protein [Candidatus Brocadiales bacterium]
MNILMLNPPFLKRFSRAQRSPAVIKSGTLYYPIWLAYATGVLEKEGHCVKLLDAPAEGLSLETVLNLTRDFKPQLAVLDTSTPSIHSDIKVAEEIKRENPDCFIALVGTHVSALPEETLRLSASIDAVARGEYDFTLKDLASVISSKGNLKDVSGLSFRNPPKADEIIQNAGRPYIKNLDDLPFASRVYKKHLKIENYFYSITKHPQITIMTSRGCPHQCTFCVYPQTIHGHSYRRRSVPNVIEEFKFIKKEFPQVKEIFIEDDTFTLDKRYCTEFSEKMISEGINIPWTANSRVDVKEETLKLLKKANCRLLCIGIESGDQTILDNIRKGIKLAQIKEFVENAKRVRILVHACFVVGNPGETKETLKKTLDFAKELKPDTVQFFPLMVYPGTDAYKWAKENGYLQTQDYSRWITEEGLHNCVISTPELSSDDLVRFCDEARRVFYLRPGYVLSKVAQMLTHPSEAKRILKTALIFSKHLFKGSQIKQTRA